MSLAETDVFRARWTEAINDEWVRNLKAHRPKLNPETIDRTRRRMNESMPDCLITGNEGLIPSLTAINQKDRHVVAAAIHVQADVIVTYNIRDFPEHALGMYGINVQHPDQFVSELINLHLQSGIVFGAIRKLRTGLKNPPVSPEGYLSNLEMAELTESASLLRLYLPRI